VASPRSRMVGPGLSWVLVLTVQARPICDAQTLVGSGVTGFDELFEAEPNLEFTLSTSLEEDMCKRVPRYSDADNNVKVQALLDDCETFCGDSIPLLIGSGQFGMNIQQVSDICMRELFSEPLSEHIKDCSEAAKQVNKVEEAAVTLIAALDEFQYQKMLFVAEMRLAADKIKEEVTDQEFIQLIESEKRSGKPALLKEELKSIMDQREFTRPIREIKTAVEVVVKRVESVLTKVKAAVSGFEVIVSDKCTEVYAGVSPADAVVLDLCAQGSSECIDDEEGEHVACCCGFSPVANIKANFNIKTIRGTVSRRLEDIDEVKADAENLSRRLEEEIATGRKLSGLISKIPSDICTEAENEASSEKTNIKKKLDELGASNLYELHETKIRTKYEDYYRVQCAEEVAEAEAELECDREVPGSSCNVFNCNIGVCVDGTCFCDLGECWTDGECTSACANVRRLEEEKEEEMVEASDAVPSDVRALQAMNLNGGAGCDVPDFDPTAVEFPTDRDFEVVFTPYLETDTCENLQKQYDWKMTDNKMIQECEKFCGEGNVPILLGTTSYGFSLNQAADVVKSVLGVSDKPTWETCEEGAKAFFTFQDRFINFVAASEEFSFSVMRFDAEMRARQQEVVEFLKSAEFGEDLSREVDKKQWYVDEVSSRLWAGSVRIPAYMKRSLNLMKDYVKSLEELVGSADTMTKFVEDCTEMELGVGTGLTTAGEFLLDICSQRNDQCFDNEEHANHVSCACGINRALWIGQKFVNAPGITGSDAFGTATDPGAGRRLQDDDDESFVNICGEAHHIAADAIQEHKAAIADSGSGGQDILDEYQAQKDSEHCTKIAKKACADAAKKEQTSSTTAASLLFAAACTSP